MTAEVLAVSLLTGAEAAHFYSAFCPSIFTIRQLAVPEGREADIRRGMLIGLMMSIGIGLIVAYIFKSWLPLLFAAGIGAAMYFLYEYHLREVT